MKTSGWRDIMKYKLIPEDIVKNMIDFLDEYQFEAAKEGPTTNPEALHKINFCNWMINELLNSHDGFDSNQVVRFNIRPSDDKSLKDKDWDSILKTFDSFFKGWDNAYKKDGKKEKPKPKKQDEDWKPHLEDISEHCTLKEIEEFLKDDPELTDNERFELYYEEHRRVQKEKERIKREKNNAGSLDDMCKDLGIKRNPGKKK